ncbi:HNH endonuclease [Bacillus thuringiensis]|uniref:HNH endonuclease n=1 Tax=Bacillus thuringiensis TaxID=1428 RepID=UPI003017CC1E
MSVEELKDQEVHGDEEDFEDEDELIDEEDDEEFIEEEEDEELEDDDEEEFIEDEDEEFEEEDDEDLEEDEEDFEEEDKDLDEEDDEELEEDEDDLDEDELDDSEDETIEEESEEEGQEIEDEPVIGEGIFQPVEEPSEVFLQNPSVDLGSGIVLDANSGENLEDRPRVVLEKNMDTDEIEDSESRETLSLLSSTSETLSDMGIEKENYTLTYVNNIKLTKIAISEPMKKGRASTIVGLTKSIGELGVVTPIHLMKLETADEDEDSDMPAYQTIDGLRRIYSSVKNNLETIPAIVWDFKDKQKGRQAALILGLTLNRQQKRTWSEIWDLYTILERQTQIKPNTFESLFQLEGGDAMKLKDVVLSEYTEVKEELFSNEKTLEQCYKNLQKLRKEENTLEIEDQTGFADTSDMAKDVVEGEEKPEVQLSNDEVLAILEMGEALDKEINPDDFGSMGDMFGEVTHQDVKNRKPVDPIIKQQTLARDDYRCRCCGTGGKAFLSTIIFHHIVPVHADGPDTVANGLTLCDSCHITLHVIERNGRLPLTEEEFKEYEPEDQWRIKNILHYARIAIMAGKNKGLTDEQRKELAKSGTRHRMPGEGNKENQQGFALYEQDREDKKKEETTA